MTAAISVASPDYCRPGAQLPTRRRVITRDAINAYLRRLRRP